MNVLMFGHHARRVHATLNDCNGKTSNNIDVGKLPRVDMEAVGQRIRQRMGELSIRQSEAARACGCSAARFSNYLVGKRSPDLATLARIAVALQTTTDWLIGLSEAAPVDVEAVIRRILELDGMAEARASVIAQAAEAALRLLAALPTAGDAQTRALLAAQAAWQMKSPPKQS